MEHLRDRKEGNKKVLKTDAILKRAFQDNTANVNVTMLGRAFRKCSYSVLSGFITQQACHVTYLFRCGVGSASVTCAACGGVTAGACGVFVLVPPAVRHGSGCSLKASTRWSAPLPWSEDTECLDFAFAP